MALTPKLFSQLDDAQPLTGNERIIGLQGSPFGNVLISPDQLRIYLESNDVTATAANISDIGNAINTTDKYAGKRIWDTTNNRELRASGSAAGDAWHVIDGSATVTPS